MHRKVLNHFLQKAVQWQPEPWRPTEFEFSCSASSANHNWAVLQKYNLDLDAALRAQSCSALNPGSEFRPVSILHPLLGKHPLWQLACQWLTAGVSFPVLPLSESDRIEDLQIMLQLGNHKSAEIHASVLNSAIAEEVSRGWMLPLPSSIASELPHAIIAPMGVAVRQVIDEEKGQLVGTFRITHDQSFNAVKGTSRSVNDRILQGLLTPCKFGRCMHRFSHAILFLRQSSPDERIFITKADGKAAYRRLHLSGQQALQSLVIIGTTIFVALRMTFGGAANPSRWSDLSEMMCDLANDIVRNPGWEHTTMQSPHQALVPILPETLDSNVPIATCPELAVEAPTDYMPKCDVYLDDILAASKESDLPRLSALLAFVVHIFGRPNHPEDAFPRDDLLSLKKFEHEGRPSECKIVLGWLLDTRRLRVSLPALKAAAWSASINTILKPNRKTTAPELASLIGRLSNAATIIPQARHFLSRIRRAEWKAAKTRTVTLTADQRMDLRLWLQFLEQAKLGVSLLCFAIRDPTTFHRTDACPHGLGG